MVTEEALLQFKVVTVRDERCNQIFIGSSPSKVSDKIGSDYGKNVMKKDEWCIQGGQVLILRRTVPNMP